MRSAVEGARMKPMRWRYDASAATTGAAQTAKSMQGVAMCPWNAGDITLALSNAVGHVSSWVLGWFNNSDGLVPFVERNQGSLSLLALILAVFAIRHDLKAARDDAERLREKQLQDQEERNAKEWDNYYKAVNEIRGPI